LIRLRIKLLIYKVVPDLLCSKRLTLSRRKNPIPHDSIL
ncbi:hypothetical protein M086_3829, partial [Bacteroides fragilis str. S13 L11]